MRKFSTAWFAAALLLVMAAGAGAQDPTTPSGQPVPKEKQTAPGLYRTAAEAYAWWKAAPENVAILDVRTPEEFLFVGHPVMAWNIPVALQTFEWDPVKKHFAMKLNPDFVARAREAFAFDDTLLVICRSGGRSALAINKLAEAGFSRVYNIIDGVEGDLVTDRGSPDHGKRLKNGWKNAGLPWTYEIDPERMRLPPP
jgi:rhodanese-related sulfurtransferase